MSFSENCAQHGETTALRLGARGGNKLINTRARKGGGELMGAVFALDQGKILGGSKTQLREKRAKGDLGGTCSTRGRR